MTTRLGGHSFTHFPLDGHDRHVERAGQGEEVGDHRRGDAVGEVGHEHESTGRRGSPGGVDRSQHLRPEAMLGRQRIAFNERHVVTIDQPIAGQLGEPGIDFDRDHSGRSRREPFGQRCRAGTHLQHHVFRTDLGRAGQ